MRLRQLTFVLVPALAILVAGTVAYGELSKNSSPARLDLAQVRETRTAPLILIDPGHGGTNTGAASVRPDIFEKHMTLAMAESLRARLEAKGYQVRLTRNKDTYLSLRQRGRMANELDVDLFVSLHGNATESHSHSGFETYILTPEAVDLDSRALRFDSGRTRAGVDAQTGILLDDIERATSQARASELAETLQSNMRKLRGKAGDRGVRQQSMDVLFGATMPAILIEVGFIDHPIEGEELLDAELRDKICDAIASAIESHAEALVARL